MQNAELMSMPNLLPSVTLRIVHTQVVLKLANDVDERSAARTTGLGALVLLHLADALLRSGALDVVAPTLLLAIESKILVLPLCRGP